MIYMDNAAGTKPDARVVEAMLPFLTEQYGNPSAHFYPLGRTAYEAVEKARGQVAELIGAKSEEIIFTANGTESNNIAIKGLVRHPKYADKKHIIISETEHFSIQNVVVKLLNDGYQITKLKVDNNGLISLDDLKKAIRPDTLVVSVAHANPEIGVIQETAAIGAICKEAGVLFHVDAVASAGHVAIDVNAFNADLLSLAAQNFYGPRGAAALFVREGVRLVALVDGGHQERGLRSGSENVPAIVGMGEAARIAKAEMPEYTAQMLKLRERLWNGIAPMFDFLHFTGHATKRLPGHVSFWVEYIEGESLLLWFSLKGVFAASGSACSSNILAEDEEDLEASHVLTAIGVPNDICAGSLGLSLSKYNTEADVDHVLEILPEIVKKLCEMSPAYNK